MDWSRDGSLLTFAMLNDSTGLTQIVTLSTDGQGTLTTVSTGTAPNPNFPVFSPNGSQILFYGETKIGRAHV